MSTLDDLVWTSRAEVCAKLFSFLSETIDDPEPMLSRFSARFLLSHVAGEPQAPALLRLALEPGADASLRSAALATLVRVDFTCSEPDLVRLLDEAVTNRERRDRSEHRSIAWHGPVPLGDVLRLCRTPAERRMAYAFLERLSAVDRAELLIDISDAWRFTSRSMRLEFEPDAHPDDFDWVFRDLYGPWLEGERHFQDRSLVRRVALATRSWSSSQDVLLELWREAEGSEREVLLHDLTGSWRLERLAMRDRALLDEAARALALPVRLLVDVYGPEEAWQRVATELRSLEGPLDDQRRAHFASFERRRLLRLIASWKQTIEETVALLDDTSLSIELRRGLLGTVASRARARAVAWAQDALSREEHHAVLGELVRVVSLEPRAGDRELLLGCMNVPALRRHARLGARKLIPAVEWRDRLERIPFDGDEQLALELAVVRVRAGEPRELETIRHVAASEDFELRTDALRDLAELDPAGSLPLLAAALRRGPPRGGFNNPLPDAIGPSLVRLGTADAMNALMRAHLAGSLYLAGYLRDLAGRLEAPDLAPEEVRLRLAESFRDVLSRNLGTDGRRDHYGIEVLTLDGATGEGELAFTFVAGHDYCCGEPGCHFGGGRSSLRRVRQAMKARGIGHLPPLSLRVAGRCEPGARLECHRAFGLPLESEGYSFAVKWEEDAPRRRRDPFLLE